MSKNFIIHFVYYPSAQGVGVLCVSVCVCVCVSKLSSDLTMSIHETLMNWDEMNEL